MPVDVYIAAHWGRTQQIVTRNLKSGERIDLYDWVRRSVPQRKAVHAQMRTSSIWIVEFFLAPRISEDIPLNNSEKTLFGIFSSHQRFLNPDAQSDLKTDPYFILSPETVLSSAPGIDAFDVEDALEYYDLYIDPADKWQKEPMRDYLTDLVELWRFAINHSWCIIPTDL